MRCYRKWSRVWCYGLKVQGSGFEFRIQGGGGAADPARDAGGVEYALVLLHAPGEG